MNHGKKESRQRDSVVDSNAGIAALSVDGFRCGVYFDLHDCDCATAM